jgi:hypothetical protein
MVFTIVSDHYNVSVEDITAYADAFLKRSFKNMNSLLIWIFPVMLMIKREVAMWRQSIHDRDIEVAKINSSKTDCSTVITTVENK